jgi:hypothetical protein
MHCDIDSLRDTQRAERTAIAAMPDRLTGKRRSHAAATNVTDKPRRQSAAYALTR